MDTARLRAQIETLAREIGAVSSVSQRTPDRQHLAEGEQALMIRRLDDWYTRLFDMRDSVAEAEARIATLEGRLKAALDGEAELRNLLVQERATLEGELEAMFQRYDIAAAERDQAEELLEVAEDLLEAQGYRRCDIAACNCGSWHQLRATRERGAAQ